MNNMTTNDLMLLAAEGDESAINVLDMIDDHDLDRNDEQRITEVYLSGKRNSNNS